MKIEQKINKIAFYREKASLFKECADMYPRRDLLSLFGEWCKSKNFSDEDKREILEIARVSALKKAYSAIDSVMEEVFLDEEQALQGMCSLLELENLKFKSKIIEEVISVLRQWNKIPANEIKAKVEEIKSRKI
ncbi:MAG: hypothetical protein Q8N76_06655 [Candidatus Omnitrophota bacterium]|nr:hypothetical protein [Candidatus Omnitrophota bacterium]